MRGTSSTRPSAPSAAATAALASSESRVRVTTVWGRTTPVVSGRTGRARVSSSAMSGGSIRDVSADDSTLEVPADVSGVAVGDVGRLLELGVEAVLAVAVDLDLGEEGERHAVVDRAE